MQSILLNSKKVRAAAQAVAVIVALSAWGLVGDALANQTSPLEPKEAERAELELESSRQSPLLESPVFAPSALELKTMALERRRAAKKPKLKQSLAITQAAPAPQTSVSAAPPAKSQKSWSLNVDLSAASSFLERTDADYSSSLTLTLIPSLKLGKGFTLSARTDISQEIQPEEKFTWLDSSLSLRHQGTELNPFLKLSPGVSVAIPTHSETRRRDSIRSAVSMSARLLWKLDPISLSILSGYLELGGTRRFHEFETKTNGSLNSPWGLNLTSVTQLGLSERLSLTLLLRRSSNWSYQGGLRNSFIANPELGYQLFEKLSLSLGVSTEGKLLKDNGVDSDFAIFDGRRSQFYGGLGFVF